jgi:PKD repeat protein
LISLVPLLVAHLAAMPAAGTAPLVVGFDTARSSAGTIAEHLVLLGNGDAISLALATQTTNYNYTLPGFYLAQSWLRDETGIALSPPVPISVARQSDGLSPATATVTVNATTDALTYAFMATLTPAAGDAISAQRWEFGDGGGSGDAAPFHTYARAGVYQAALVATTRAGLPIYGRVVVVVRDASGAVPPSLLLTVTPEDQSLLTPLTLTAYVEGVPPDAKVVSAEVDWPDLADASPTVTPTAAGITVTSQHALAAPGYYDVPVTVQLASQMDPLVALAHITVANIDDSSPSPIVLAPPAATATAGAPYAPGTSAGALLVAGAGPFAFGAAAPSPSNFGVDDGGKIHWTPTGAQLGPQRVAVRIVDVQGHETVKSWVVDVAPAKKGGCAMGGDAAPSPWAALLLLVVYGVMARQLAKQGTKSCAPPASERGSPTAPPT